MEARSPEVDRFPESSPSQGHFAIELGVGYPYGGAYLKPLLLHWQAGITYDQITLDENFIELHRPALLYLRQD